MKRAISTVLACAACVAGALALSGCAGLGDGLLTPDPVGGEHDTTGPSISIAGISDGGLIFADTPLSVSVSDSESTVYDVTINIDGTDLFNQNYSSYNVTVPVSLIHDPLQAGSHTLNVRARDAVGNSGFRSLQYVIVP